MQAEQTFVKDVPYKREIHYDAFLFDDIRNTEMMFVYFTYNFLQIIHEDDLNDATSPYVLNLGLMVGAPRLRQIRINPRDECHHEISSEDVKKWPCYGEYTSYNEYKGYHQGLIFEIMPTGLVVPTADIRCIPLKCFLSMDVFRILIGIVFYLIVIYYTYTEIYEICAIGPKAYIRDAYNYTDRVFLLSSYVVLSYNIWHTLEVNAIYDAYNADREVYINLDRLMLGWRFYSISMGILTFSVWLKFIRFMSFHRSLRRLSSTIQLSLRNVLGFCFIFICIVYAFALWGTILFGDQLDLFKSEFSTVMTILRILMADVDYGPMYQIQPVLGPIYFVSLVVVIFGISLNLFVAIYLSTYLDVKANTVVHDTLILKMLKQGIKDYFRIWRSRPLRSDEIKTSATRRIERDTPVAEEVAKESTLGRQPIITLREDLAAFTERSIQMENMLESLVVTIENIAKLQNQREKKAK
ncbi:GH19515 [Drosophila grimshawi]|uniref:GH19515 n=2 Tax=Drosophila grimshawi TaxID=7222 RepID=B4JGZ7_DROGR|nr:GH19515 [Drosophila grimshawi]